MILDNLTQAAHNVNRLRVEIVFESCGLHVDIVVCLANPQWENNLACVVWMQQLGMDFNDIDLLCDAWSEL